MKQIRKGAPYLLALSVLTFLVFVFFPRSSSQQQGPTLYVNNIDPTCGGSSPCFASIQAAVDAAVSGDTIRIRAGTYLEQVTIAGKNDFAEAGEADRITIEADPSDPPGGVVLDGSVEQCTNGFAILLQQSKFITIRGLTITGAGGQGLFLMGGNNQNQAIHIERNRIFGNGSSDCNGGIMVARGNPDTLIANNLIYGNGRNGITFIDADGGPHYIVGNTIHGNQWNGLSVARSHEVILANNVIAQNGTAAGSTGGRFGVDRESSTSPEPEGIDLLNNLICGNTLGEINGPALDATDSGNLTPEGTEGPGVSASPGCEVPANVYANVNGPDGLPGTADDDFRLAAHSPAIDRGMDPRTLGLDPAFNSIFEADFATEAIRPSDGDADRVAAFDMGGFEFPNQAPIADAGPDQTAFRGQLVSLDGTQSQDPEGAALSFQWTVLSQPAGSAITLSNPASATPQFSPLVLGQYVFQLVVNDGQFDSAPDTVVVTVVNRAPTADAGGPYAGSVGVAVQFNGAGSDPDGDAITFSWDFGDGATGSGPNPAHVYATGGTFTVILTVTDALGAFATSQTSATITAGVVLNPIGDKIVNLGETLIFTVSATGTGGPISLFVSPLPLPNHATFNATTGEFRFTPDTTQVGSFPLTFSAVSGDQSDSETITITVPSPPPGGTTAVRGHIENLNDTPLGNVKVTLKATGQTAFSGTDGFFTLSGVPSGKQELIVNGREANLGVFAILTVPVNLIDGVLNTMASSIVLPDVDVEAEVQVSPTFTTVISNPNVPGVSLTIGGGTAFNSDGTLYSGMLSINPVPEYGRPESRPEELRPGLAITIQPAGVRFSPAARLTFPNADGMAPGSELNLWSLSPDTGTFSIVGKMVVSADGSQIITVEGGVVASAWHFPLAPSPEPADASAGTLFCPGGRCKTTSEANLQEGSLFLTHALPSYRSLGQSRSRSLTYNSITADVKPIVSLDATLSVRAAVPNTYSTRLQVGGMQQGEEVFTDTSSLPENQDSTSRLSVQFDASNLSTGRYPYQAAVFSNYQNSSIGGITDGNLIIVNRKTSPFGAGWGLTDLQELHVQPSGSVVLTTGDGLAFFFAGGPDTFTSPPGDFSTLIRNPDGTFTRTLKDGTQVNFDAQGLETSIVDRNNNATAYGYDASGRLTTITDPAGLITTFTYSGDKLEKIADPEGRETLFQHDASGNLIRITNPDATFVSYAHDGQGRVTQATDERGNATGYAYDFAGRLSQSTRNGETRTLTSSRLQGLADTAGGQGTPANPVPVVRSQNATSSLTDGNNNPTTFTLDSLGQIVSQTDALGNTTTIERDLNGNPTKITRPNGGVVSMTYDSLGNLLTSTDPVGATTTFAYEPNFNQVSSIKDPKNNTTTINYDTSGNPIEIIDALGNRTQMTYDARGLLTSVTSAVGKPEQNTTSFAYDARGNLETTTDPNGFSTTLFYDNAGNVIKSTDAEGRVTEFTYDAFNRLTTVKDAELQITSYLYDAKGNLKEVIDARKQITTFDYDEVDRLLSATNPLGLTETFTYDANGNLTSTTNRNGQTISFDYDALNRLIKKTRPPTSTEVGPQITTFNYDSVGNLVTVLNPVIGVFNQYDLANRLVSSTSSTEEALAGTVTQINEDTTIGENNFQFEGKTIQVNGKTVTVNGSHTFANLILVNGTLLTHDPTTATKVNKLDIRVTGTLQIDAASRIDVTGRGFLGGGQPGNPFPVGFGGDGMTVGFQRGSTGRSGGSYGGLGGSSGGGSSNPVYGDFRDPNDPGSGGASFAGTAGSGGGLVRIVAKALQLDGVIKADGGTGPNYGGGSGGGIRIDVETLAGVGQITAKGATGGPDNGGGGGGGRVAVYYQAAAGFDFAKVFASGNTGNAAPNGGAGTVYLQGPGRESGELVVDNSNVVAPSLSTPLTPQPLADLRIRRGAKGRVDAVLTLSGTLEISSSSELALASQQLSASAIEVTASGSITHLFTTASAFFKVDLSANNLTVDATSSIDVAGRGFLGGGKPGNPFPVGFGGDGMTVGFQRGSTGRSGGSYGGLGGSSGGGSSNPVYGDFRDPNDPGSGGASAAGTAGNGGGLVRIVAQTLQLDGLIKADGETPTFYGGGSGGGIRIDVGTLQGTGQITANGGNGQPDNGGGGGGGRIAIYYQNASGFDLTKVTTFGGTGNAAPNGGAGTVYLQGAERENGELIADNNNVAAPSQSTPILSTASNLLTLTHLRAKRAAKMRVDDPINLSGTLEVSFSGEFIPVNRVIASTIDVNTSGTVTQLPTTATALFKVDLIADTLTLDATGRIDVSVRGFLGGGKPGNPFGGNGMTIGFQQGSTGRSGGSYGGLGGSSGGGSSNPVYGDLTDPNDPGSGGATPVLSGPAGSGGGLIRVVAQTLNLGGVITADGETPAFYGAGSGGGIRIDVGTLQGTGQITANGGNGQRDNGGGGGGGRIAVYYQSAVGFDLTRVTALGGLGTDAPNGEDGTVHLEQTFAMWTPTDGDYPVRKAEVEEASVVELASADRSLFTDDRSLPQLASLDSSLFTIHYSQSRIPDYADLMAKMQAQSPQVPQRRVYVPVPPDDSRMENRALALLTPDASPLTDVDPIYTYDLNGNRISMIDPTGLTIYTYDALNRLTSITNNKGKVTSFTYDALGRRTSMTHGNGVVTTYGYDLASQLLNLVHQFGATTINSFDYTYDKVGNRKTKVDQNGNYGYTYDALNRLLEAVNPLPSNPLETYNYDEVGNRLDSNQNGLSTFNQANQLEEDADFTYQYDNNGNLIQKTPKTPGPFTSYEYDAENKLVRVVTNGTTANYRYDGLGRRVEKEITQATVTTTSRYIYDNEDILLELDGSNNIVARYTHGPGIDEPLIMEKGDTSFLYHADGLGSITELTDSAGTVVQSYTYSSFGKIESQSDPNFVQPYTFTARELDPETALYHYRARDYDPLVGRFLQEDPLGLAGGVNLFSYVRNSPVNFIDSFGLVRLLAPVDLGAMLKINQQVRSALDFLPGFLLDAFFPVAPQDILESGLTNLVCPLSTGGQGARFFGKNVERLGKKVGRRLAQLAGGPLEVFNSNLPGGFQGAIKFFQEQAGRLPVSTLDIAEVGGRRFIFRPSTSGSPTVEVVDFARRTIEKIRFLQ